MKRITYFSLIQLAASFLKHITILVAILGASAATSFAQATFTWNGSASTAWNNAANWTKVGTSTSTWPGENAGQTDNVVIEAGTPNNPNLGAFTVTNPIASFTQNSGSFNTGTTGGFTLTGNLTRTGGNISGSGRIDFQAGLGTITISITGSGSYVLRNADISSGTVTNVTNVTFQGNVIIQGGTLQAGAGITIAGASSIFRRTSGSFNAGTFTLTFNGTGTQRIESNIGLTFNNLFISGLDEIEVVNTTGSPITHTITGTLTRQVEAAAATVTLDNGSLPGSGGGTASLAYSGINSGLSYLSSLGDEIPIGSEWPAVNGPANLTVSHNGPSPRVVTTAPLSRTLTRNLTISAGILGGGSSSNLLNVEVQGNITTGTLTTTGSFENGTITLTGNQPQTIAGGTSSTVSNLTINKTNPTDVVTLASGTLDITGTLRVQSGTLALSNGNLDVGGATLRVDNGATLRSRVASGNTGTITGAPTFQFEDGSIYDYNGGTILLLDNDDGTLATAMQTSNSYSILQISADLTVPVTDLDVRTELRFNPANSVIVTTNSLATTGGGLIRLGPGATITGENLTTPTRYVNGPIRRYFTSAQPSGRYVIGKNSPAGANAVTITFVGLSGTRQLTIEQFNANPSGSIPGGAPSATRYWRFLQTAGAGFTSYGITATINGSGIPSPENRVALLATGSFGGTPTYATLVGTDDGTNVTTPTSAFTSLNDGGTPGFTLGQTGVVFWVGGGSGSWDVPSNWSSSAVPTLSDNVVIGALPPSVPAGNEAPVVTIPNTSSTRNVRTLNLGGLTTGAPELIIQDAGGASGPIDMGTSGAGWVDSRTAYGTTATVEFQVGDIRIDEYPNLDVTATSGTQLTLGATTVRGNLTKGGAGTFQLNHPVIIDGSVTISAGTLNAGSQTVTVGGNFSRTGTFTAGTSTIVLNGSATQTITGTTTFNNVTISKTAGQAQLGTSTDATINGALNLVAASDGLVIGANTLTLNGTITGSGNLSGTAGANLIIGGTSGGDLGTIRFLTGNQTLENFTMNRTGPSASATMGSTVTVNSTLTMTSGILNTTTTNLLTTALTSGGSASSYVNGPLAIGGTGSSSPKVYPIGKGTTFRPVELATSSPATVQRMELFNSSPRGIAAPPLVAISDFRYWQGTNIQANDQIRLSFIPSEDAVNVVNANLRVASNSTGVGGSNNFSDRGSNGFTAVLGIQTVQSAALPASEQFFTLGSQNLVDAPLPVELVSFVGTGSRKGIELSWRTGSERESFGFVVNRRRAGGNWEVLDSYERNPSLRARNSLSGAEYFFIDRSPMNAGDVLEYRLDEVAFDGTVERLKEIRVEAAFSTIVTDYALEQNYPNPFNPATTIPYQLKDRAKVTLDIYNALGQKITTLVNAEQESGRYAPTFNATALASGMYFYRLQAVGARESFTQTRKMMLVK